MDELPNSIFDQLDVGVGICDVDTLLFVSANATLSSWFALHNENEGLPDHLSDKELKRLNMAVEKKRFFRFKKTILIRGRDQSIDFVIHLIEVDAKPYVMIQGAINNSDTEIQTLIKNHEELTEKNNELLRQERNKTEAANNAKSAFMANISHELRTPMNAIIGFTAVLKKKISDEKNIQLIEYIADSSNALLKLINGLLVFSTTPAERLKMDTTTADLSKIIKKTIYKFKEAADKKGVAIEYREGEGVPKTIEVQLEMLNQILSNILDNALKFTCQGKIELTVSCDSLIEKMLVFSVSDTGIGIDNDYLESMFAPFTQEDSAINRKYSGAGLSLSICKQYIEQMAGRIWCVSEKGVGTTVYFSLPYNTKNKNPI